jgi:hypothetical protein
LITSHPPGDNRLTTGRDQAEPRGANAATPAVPARSSASEEAVVYLIRTCLAAGVTLAAVGLSAAPAPARAAPAAVAPAVAGDPTQTNYTIKTLVLKYFPLTANGQNIDITVTGDVGDPLATEQAHVNAVTTTLTQKLSAGTAYHQYNNSAATPSVSYSIADTKEYHQAVPTVANPDTASPYKRVPDYNGIMSSVGICNYVNQGVSDVWMWAYQGPSQLGISESKMSGPYGDISNSPHYNNMPQCGHTYRVYTFNYGRGSAEAAESYGHQIEAELDYVDHNTFRNLYENSTNPYPGNGTTVARCGSVHNPPNAQFEYDRADATPHASDCPNWFPDGLGTQVQISCANWGCANNSDSDNSSLNYIVWWMQNMPGKGNQVALGGHHLRNWWDVHANFDTVAGSSKSLTINYPCSGYVCDNLDPTATFNPSTGAYCSAGATTATGGSIPADGGTLELRWGANCQVNWARFTPNSSGGAYYIWVGRQSPGFNAYGYQFSATAGVQYYSDQVYAPGAAHACVLQWNGSTWTNQVCTNWI